MSDLPVETEEAPAEETETEASEASAHSYLMALDTRSSDGRLFDSAGCAWRPLPLPLMLMEENAPGHDGSIICGSILTIDIVDTDAGKRPLGTIKYADTDDGARAQKLVGDQILRWVSVDYEPLTWTERVTLDGVEIDNFEDLDDDDWANLKWELDVHTFNINGATILPFPAFPEAVIAPIDQELEVVQMEALEAAVAAGAIVACGYDGDAPRAAFEDPKLTELTPLQVTDDGRVFGHLAGWNTPHLSFPGRQVLAPKSKSNYAHFLLGEYRTQEGDRIPVGSLTVSTGHADLTLGQRDAAAHYDNTGTAVAQVNCGEDEHGIWVAGVVSPSATPQQVRELRAHPLSGDWRPIGNSLELVAALAVNVPGFGIPRIGMAASGGIERQTALVAAGVVTRRNTVATMRRQLSNMEKVLAPQFKEQAKALAASLKSAS